MKKALIFLLVSLFTIFAVFPAFAIVDQSEDFYVADYANVFSRDFEERIIQLNGDLEHYCSGAQLVVVTVDYLDGMYSDEYAMKLFNNWGVGDASENNGMLLLLAVKENKAWLTVGKGISLSTSKIDSMFESYFWSDFDRGNYEEATEQMLDALTTWYVKEYDVDTSSTNSSLSSSHTYYTIDVYITFLVLILIIILIKNAVRGARVYYRNGAKGSILPWLFMYSHPRRYFGYGYRHHSHSHFDDDDDDDHFGGSGGGSSSGSRRSSGFSGFGGFGGFSGGSSSGGGFSGGGSGGGGFGGGGGGRR